MMERTYDVVAENVDNMHLRCQGEWVRPGKQVVVVSTTSAEEAEELVNVWIDMLPIGFRVTVL